MSYTLSNQQLLFIYYHLKVIDDKYQKTLDTRSITQTLVGDAGYVVVNKLPDSVLDMLSTSTHFKLVRETVETLRPIAELIEDVEPEMATEVKELFEDFLNKA